MEAAARHEDQQGEGEEDEEANEMRPFKRRPRKRTSPVWEAFHITEEGVRVCDHCEREFGMTTSTTSLKYHLEREHEIYETDDDHRFNAKQADMLVARFVANNCLALRTTSSVDFIKMVTYLRKGYKPPGKDRLKAILGGKLKTGMVEAMRRKIRSIDHYSLTLDSWTSPAGRPYVGITLHGATPSFELESFMLGLVPVKASETAKFIAHVVEEVIQEWGIDRSKIMAITSDGAKNMSAAVRSHLKVEWVYCLAHVINLCVRLTLKKTPGIKDVVKAAKAVCRTFKASAIARRALEDRQADLGLPKRPLKLDNKTRWGSTYEMLRRLTASRPAVSACLGTLHGLRKPVADDLTSAQWSLIKKIADVLEPFQDATEFLSHEKHPTMGAVMPIVLGAIPKHLKVIPADGPEIEAFKKNLSKNIDIRWDMINVNASETMLLAVYLDPRFKDFAFIQDAEGRDLCVRRAIEALSRLVQGTTAAHQVGADVPSDDDEEAEQDTSYVAKMNRLFGRAGQAPPPRAIDGDAVDEVERYQRKSLSPAFEDHVTGGDTPTMLDPLTWWKQHKAKFPRLAALARRYLSVTCTSVPSERVFSKCGWIINKRRCSLSDKTAALLAFVSCNHAHLPN
ncbi:hAT family C-terminal dimerization region domain containing protein [Pandoravirus macleodensis]|uniref:HAT family C-terminal dimerization region domain containing protein n=1 Tax=Pandoravirus macleodensis TaxID=2107707 RepID=A0A2U7UFC9_9VIRU|nr:hAT family C-terminal dimerization region domain containing protein [Pandoravirus macleodensis]AVK77112.1 hAT family C-terminal dimerization region domain containing protein [Pandoravirus macleodensis]